MRVQPAQDGARGLSGAEQVVPAGDGGEGVQLRARPGRAAPVGGLRPRQRNAGFAERPPQPVLYYQPQFAGEEFGDEGLGAVHRLARRPRRRVPHRHLRLVLTGSADEAEYRGVRRGPLRGGRLRHALTRSDHHREDGHALAHHGLVDIAAHDYGLLIGAGLGNVEEKQQRSIPQSGLYHRDIVEKICRRGLCGAYKAKFIVSDAKFGKKLVRRPALKVGKIRQGSPGDILADRSLLDESEIRMSLYGRIRDQIE